VGAVFQPLFFMDIENPEPVTVCETDVDGF
jgi:hypothetical protein